MKYDIVFLNGFLIDPVNQVEGFRDIAIKMGKIKRISKGFRKPDVKNVVDLQGKVVLPGIIDSHVHLSSRELNVRSKRAFQMVARTGVVTAIDFAGSANALKKAIEDGYGAGLNVGFLKPVIPGKTVSSKEPPLQEIKSFMADAAAEGAVGVKLLGGHFPVTPETFKSFVKVASEQDILVAAHVGTTEKPSALSGLAEAIELAGDYPLYVAHVNSYCRGLEGDHPVEEAALALKMIRGKPNIIASSYIAKINCTSGHCQNGIPDSEVTKNMLRKMGYPQTEEGLATAIKDGNVFVHANTLLGVELITGGEGYEHWLKGDMHLSVSFESNSMAVCSALASAKDDEGNFIIDILSTDGGAIPRNNLVQNGLLLRELGSLSLKEFVLKASVTPARIFNLKDKGHLAPGADADLTILDLERNRAYLGVARGRIIMADQQAFGKGGTIVSG